MRKMLRVGCFHKGLWPEALEIKEVPGKRQVILSKLPAFCAPRRPQSYNPAFLRPGGGG